LARQRTIFLKQKRRSSPYRILVWMGMILAGLMVFRGVVYDKTIQPFFAPTPTATRSVRSFQQEADTYFKLGALQKAIDSYQEVIRQNPDNAELIARLVRIQVYSSATMATDQQKLDRLNEALQLAERAVQINPDDSNAHAVKALVLDWLSSNKMLEKKVAALDLETAQNEVTRATQLDANNAEALAYSAEILADRAQWLRADQVIQDALAKDPNSMDVHRVRGYVLTALAEYDQAIEEYKKAAAIYPNLTFLYIDIGQTYRVLWSKTQAIDGPSTVLKANYFSAAMDAFGQAANINKNIDVKDPIPYMAMGRSLAQRGDLGDFFSSQIYMKTALQLDPTNPDAYAQLGIVYRQSRNFEGSIEALHCALDGCTPEESCGVRRDCPAEGATPDASKQITVKGLNLTDTTLVYYYSYGSVLAAMDKPGERYCPRAVVVFNKLRELYGADPNVMAIVKAGEDICASASSAATSTPSGSALPSGTGTPPPPHPSQTPTILPTKPAG
jgi:tetratricopeptide (TPR) repeat protein